MHIVITVWVILAAWRWGDWHGFQKYHATMLYMPLMNLFYLVLTGTYPLWRVQPDFGLPFIVVVAMYVFIVYPFTVFLFLSNYPETTKKRIFHIIKWIVIYFGVEWIGSLAERITYGNSWNLGWSFLFILVMFPVLRLHYKKPLLAYLVSVVIIVLLVYLFDVPWMETSIKR